MKRSYGSLGVLLMALLLSACSRSAPAPAITGVDLASINTQTSPCKDFYQYACGNWMAHNPIPADESVWGTFEKLQDSNIDVLHQILDQVSAHPPAHDPVAQQVGDYYAACMDQANIDAAGIKPLQSDLDIIASLKSKDELADEIARLQLGGADVLFGFSSDQDFKNANDVIAEVDQGGIGLPDRDYYTKTDPKSVALRQQYQAHVQKMFELLGDATPKAAAEARTVMRLETALAQASLTNVVRRDPNAIYHKMTPAQFQALAPAFDWRAFFTATGAPTFAAMNVAVPGFFRALNTDLRSVSLDDWKTYLRWHLVHEAAPSLSQPFVDANFAFFGTTLTGQKEQKPRWKRCVNSTDSHLGEALGQLYVQRAFSPAAKAHVQEMVTQLEAALGQDIQSLGWMTPATKQQAMVKLKAIVNRIGYPDRWRDYSTVIVTRDNYYTDLRRANAFEYHRQLNKIGKPVDRDEWGMTPPTVNAYYTPIWNRIFFPAGILQPPFYSENRDPATNFGGIGVVIGHEISHGFDDQGRQFDAQGNLKDWWTPADAKAFDARAACLVNQYAGYSPLPGVHLNGKLTLGENVGDNGGARIAYMAMEAALANEADKTIGGYDRAQRFFLGFGQAFCENVRPEFARLLANVDPHSPGQFRVNGVVTNMPEFSQAFHCGPTDPMTATAKSCRVW